MAPAAGTLSFANLDDTGSANAPAVTKDGTFDLSLTGQGDLNGVAGIAYEVSTDGGSTSSGGDDNVIDAEYVDVDEDKK